MKNLKKLICTKLNEEIYFSNGELIINKVGYKKTWKVELYGVKDLSVLDKMFFEGNVNEFELICTNGEKFIGNVIVKSIENDNTELLGTGPLVLVK